jgi:hypothetical protein
LSHIVALCLKQTRLIMFLQPHSGALFIANAFCFDY